MSSVSGIETSAVPANRSLFVDCRMTRTKTAVNAISMNSAAPSLTFEPGVVAVAFTTSWLNGISIRSDARIAPANWKIQ